MKGNSKAAGALRKRPGSRVWLRLALLYGLWMLHSIFVPCAALAPSLVRRGRRRPFIRRLSQSFKVRRPVLLITVGTTHNRIECGLQEWQDELSYEDKQKVAHVRIDTTTLDSFYGYSPDYCIHLAVPPEVGDSHLYSQLLGVLKPSLMEGYIPTSSLDGGSGQRNDGLVALANRAEFVHKELVRAINQILRYSQDRDSQSRLQINIILRTFIGSSTGAGVIVALLFLLRQAIRDSKGVRANVELHVTLPDTSPGFDTITEEGRRANSMSVLLELTALARRHWNEDMSVGPVAVQGSDTPLFDQKYVYGAWSPAGTVSVDDLNLIVARQTQLHMEDQIGIGKELREARERVNEQWKIESALGLPAILHSAGHGIVRFARDELARYYAALSARRFFWYCFNGVAQSREVDMWRELTGGDGRSWIEEKWRAFHRGLPTIERSSDDIGFPPTAEAVRDLLQEAENALEQWIATTDRSRVNPLSLNLRRDIESLVGTAMESGQFDALVEQVPALLEQLADEVERYATYELRRRLDNGGENMKRVRKAMFSERPTQALVEAFIEAINGYYADLQEEHFAHTLHKKVRELRAASRSGDLWFGQVAIMLDAVADDIERFGAETRRLFPGRPASPCERYLVRKDKRGDGVMALYDYVQVLTEFEPLGDEDGEEGDEEEMPVLAADVVTEVSKRLIDYLRHGQDPEDARAVEQVVKDYFFAIYSTRLKDMSMAEVAQTLYGSDDILLSELMWARETAQQWVVPVAIDHATREAKTLEFIELAEKDYNNSAFRAKVERAFPHTEITAGNRGTEDWLVYFRSYHGLSLDLVPDFRPHGIYFKNYKAQEDAWRAYQQGLRDHHGAQLPQAGSNRNGKGRGRPIHAEPKLEQMVYEELSGYLAGTSVPPAQAPPRHQPPQPRHRPYIRRRRKP